LIRLQSFRPLPADEQRADADVMTGAFRIFIADNANRQFVRAGIEAAGDDPRLEMR
jgi:hypothetical protein